MIKRLLAILAVCMLGVAAARADTFLVGYDDDCTIFYSTYRGFYRVCPDYAPIYFGWSWGGYGWDNYWRFNRSNFRHDGFRHGGFRGGDFHGGNRGGWRGSHGGGRGTPGGHAGHGGHRGGH